MCLFVLSSVLWCSVRLYLHLFVGGLMSNLHYLCLFAYSDVNTYCVVFLFCFSSCIPYVPVCLDCPFLIAPLVLSNIYFYTANSDLISIRIDVIFETVFYYFTVWETIFFKHSPIWRVDWNKFSPKWNRVRHVWRMTFFFNSPTNTIFYGRWVDIFFPQHADFDLSIVHMEICYRLYKDEV